MSEKANKTPHMGDKDDGPATPNSSVETGQGSSSYDDADEKLENSKHEEEDIESKQNSKA